MNQVDLFGLTTSSTPDKPVSEGATSNEPVPGELAPARSKSECADRDGSATQVIDLSGGAFLDYTPAWLTAELAQRYMNALLADIAWEQPAIKIAGRSLPIPRLQAWYGERGATMAYSGRTFRAEGWHHVLLAIKSALEQCSGATFNSVLVNLYRDGQDSVSWHADDEPEFGVNPTIASVSLGQARRFSMKPKASQTSLTPAEETAREGTAAPRRVSQHLELNSGDLLIMRGATQANWVHAIPKQSRVSSPRINLTFRRVVT